MFKSSCGDHIKVLNIAIINNIIHHQSLTNKFAKAGGTKILVGLLGRGLKGAYPTGFNVLREIIATSEELANQVNDAGFMQVVTKILNKPDKVPVEGMTNAILAIRNLSIQSKTLQKAVGNTPGIFEALLSLVDHSEFQTSIRLLEALSRALAGIVKDDKEIQNMCIAAGAAYPLVMISRASKHRDLQTFAITVSNTLLLLTAILSIYFFCSFYLDYKHK